MLPVTWETIRVALHVLAATIWVGGQLTLAALVPAIRQVSPEATRVAARRFAAVAWVAYAVLAATGVWNVAAVWPGVAGAYRTTLVVKISVVVLSGVTALAHQRARGPAALAVFSALSALSALLAVFLGVLLG